MTKATVVAARSHQSLAESGVPSWMLAAPDALRLRSRLLEDASTSRCPSLLDRFVLSADDRRLRQVYAAGIVLFNFLRKHGLEVHLINTAEHATEEELAHLRESDHVLVSTSHALPADLIPLLEFVRRHNGTARVFMGGWTMFNLLSLVHGKASSLREFGLSPRWGQALLEKLRKAGADVIIGSRRGLDTALELIRQGGSGQVIFDDADAGPLSDPELFEMSSLPEYLQTGSSAIVTGVGCPFDCRFCTYKVLFERLHYLSVDEAVAVVEAMVRRRSVPLHHLRFADEVLNYPYGRLLEICRAMVDRGLVVDWSGFLRLGNVDDRLARAMRESGCSMVSIGLESGDVDMRTYMRKDFSQQAALDGIATLRRHGIIVAASLLVGYHGETPESIDNTRRLLQAARPDVARINVFSAQPPGTPGDRAPMDRDRAWAAAAWLLKNTPDQVFVTPFESFLDVFSALRALQVPAGDILAGAAEHSREWKRMIRDDVSF
ncbi:MAG: radical SAM protein [Candidatus Riflebacteria bacterium]|nr:radical SAM protein [Candidatus Riflebacteria bacterium]